MKRAPKIETGDLRFLRPGERADHLVMLTQPAANGFKQRLVCNKCDGDVWEKRRKRYVCWNCQDNAVKFKDGRWVTA